jgi:hypothetical protein
MVCNNGFEIGNHYYSRRLKQGWREKAIWKMAADYCSMMVALFLSILASVDGNSSDYQFQNHYCTP